LSTGLLMQHGPETLRFVMVDPKMVELPGYNGIPHLYGKVITDVQQVMGALAWLLIQMDDRYQLFKEVGVRNIESYNAIVRKQKSAQPLPYVVLVIDELADLMMTAAEDIERQICRLAQMARATGIHLILATQRPSTDVITGLDQGQLSHAHLLCRHQPDRQPRRARHAGRRDGCWAAATCC
jgi:S-DNA-T family DNA segregation ATPase FtsK/SpoIIIE